MRGFAAVLSVICMLCSAHSAMADKRVAFVVGNGAYRNAAALPNPPLDGKAMAALLRSIGFDVVEGINLSRDGMTERLLDFGKKAAGADIAVFFYAGHGIAVNGTNYLLPIDADIKSEADVRLGAAINVDTTLDRAMGDAKVKLVFLDACRDNPFAARLKASVKRNVSIQSGLAEMKAGENTLIAFATGPGQTALDGPAGSDSPFTRALLDNIARPGVEIQQAMTMVRAEVDRETEKGQLPWGYTNLTGAVYLNPVAGPADKAPVPVASGAAASDPELEFYRAIKDSKKPADLEAYLKAYPNGQFASLAKARIAALSQPPSKATRGGSADGVDPATFNADANQTTEDQIGLDKSQRRDVQRRLNTLGFDTKVSGKFDDSRDMIKRWQSARGYPITGYLNKLQQKALQAEIVAIQQASVSADDDRPARREGSPRRRYSRGGGKSLGGFFGGTIADLGGMVGGGRFHDPTDSPTDTPKQPKPTASATQAKPSQPDLPDFPWPPPAPSASYVLPKNLLERYHTLQEATDAIISALEATGYVERSFYRTEPGGVALVTRLERIESDGSPAHPERWASVAGNYASSADLMNFLKGLFFAKTGYYRLIVFIIQDTPFVASAKTMAEPEARALIRQGANVLPADTGARAFAGNHCTALIYEFSSDGKTVDLLAESPLTGKQHLDKAGLLSMLGKTH
jgi:uncharacterized caspase-like protein